ncbi:MAG TPA: hypothetical protein VM425_03730 [Myxococcota bacterium]|nr:hypothetical protein [Myxococcota bacterium]
MRILPSVIALAAAMQLFACGESAPLDFEAGDVQTIVAAAGDQLHPYISGDWLVWFDLRDDPNGFCFMPSYSPDGEYDDSCDGRVRSMNLATGESHILSDVIGYEVRPVVTAGLAAWRCQSDSGPGMCVTPVDRRQVTFFSGLGYSNYYYDGDKRPWVNGGYVAWAEYEYYPTTTVYRIKRADLRSGQVEDVMRLDDYPTEFVYFGSLMAWTGYFWDEGAYRYRLELSDSNTGASTLVVDGQDPAYGLGGHGGLLAFKQGSPDYDGQGGSAGGVHVFYRRPDGHVRRADSDAARVSEEGPLSVGDDLLVWLDHREGDYRVVARDLKGGGEAIVSPPEAQIGAYMPPAVGAQGIVWPDMRDGDFDLYMFRF